MRCISLPARVNQPFSARSGAGAAETGTSERKLVERVARGDRDAMRVLYGRFSVQVYRFALRLGADEGTAEDIVSEVFFEVWRHVWRFEARSKVSTWLLS